MPSTKRPLMAYCTTRDAADMLGVSLRTAQLWVERGVIDAWKTTGGHRRISRASIEKLLADSPNLRDSAVPQSDTARPVMGGGLTILVAEDEPDLLRIYKLNLARWAMRPRVLTASNGFQALVLLGSEKPDLLVLDLHMPGIDGFHLLNTLRTMPETASVAIVVVSGMARHDIEARGGVPPNILILPKPIPFAELQRIATEVAQRKQLIPSGVTV